MNPPLRQRQWHVEHSFTGDWVQLLIHKRVRTTCLFLHWHRYQYLEKQNQSLYQKAWVTQLFFHCRCQISSISGSNLLHKPISSIQPTNQPTTEKNRSEINQPNSWETWDLKPTNQPPTEKSRSETNQPNKQEKQDLETNQPGQVLMVFEKVRGQQMMMKIVESLMDSPNHNS